MEIITGSTGKAHVTPIDDAVRNSSSGYYSKKVVFDLLRHFEAVATTANEVRVYSGYGMNQGRLFKIEQGEFDTVTIENGSQNLKRSDLIVARYAMDTQSGTEDIKLVVIKGSSGSDYIDPSESEIKSGNINEGATEDDFPLYRVKINGIVIEAVEPLFTPLPDGGRLGEIENAFQNVLTALENVQNTVDNLPSDISQAASKSYVDTKVGELANGKAALFHNYSADANYGSEKSKFAGTSSKYGHVMLSDKSDFSNSTPKTATDAVAVTEKALNDAISTLKESFTDGCNAIAEKLISKGVTPTKGENTENYTPNDFISAIDALLAKRKRTVSYKVSSNTVETSRDANYKYTKTTVTVIIGGTTKTFTGTGSVPLSGLGGGSGTNVTGSWTQNI